MLAVSAMKIMLAGNGMSLSKIGENSPATFGSSTGKSCLCFVVDTKYCPYSRVPVLSSVDL